MKRGWRTWGAMLVWCRLDVSTPAPFLALRGGFSGIRRSIRRTRNTSQGGDAPSPRQFVVAGQGKAEERERRRL